MANDKKDKPINEHNAAHAHLWRLAQARAILRALDQVCPPGTLWQSMDEIPADTMKRALALVAHTRDGRIQPSVEDVRAVQRDYAKSCWSEQAEDTEEEG